MIQRSKKRSDTKKWQACKIESLFEKCTFQGCQNFAWPCSTAVFTATLVHVLVYNVCQTTHDNVKGKILPKIEKTSSKNRSFVAGFKRHLDSSLICFLGEFSFCLALVAARP